LALHDGCCEKASIRTVSSEVASGRLNEAIAMIEQAKEKWQLGARGWWLCLKRVRMAFGYSGH
jgi:hypothetical protein